MNQVTNRLVRTGSVVGLIGILSLPSASFAIAIRPGVAASDATAKSSPFCTNLSTYASGIDSKLSDLTGKADQAWTAQGQKLATATQTVDQKVSTDRQNADNQRQADFTKLMAKATTGTEQQAVQTYETAVNNAVSTRRAVYDAARTTFRSGLTAAINGRHDTVSSQISAFQSSANTAISAAQSSCSSDPSGGTAARTAFVASLKTGRQTFQSDRTSDSKIAQQAQQLASTRDAAFRAADQTFTAAMQSARQALDKAFGSASGSV